MPWGSWGAEKTQTKNKHVCFYLSNNYLCWYKWAFWERIILYHSGWRCKDPCRLEKNKRKESARPSKLFFGDVCRGVITEDWRGSANLREDASRFGNWFQKSASEHEINKWLVPLWFWFLFDGSDVSMGVKGPVVYSGGPRGRGQGVKGPVVYSGGPRGRDQGVNRLSAAQESFHQDGVTPWRS